MVVDGGAASATSEKNTHEADECNRSGERSSNTAPEADDGLPSRKEKRKRRGRKKKILKLYFGRWVDRIRLKRKIFRRWIQRWLQRIGSTPDEVRCPAFDLSDVLRCLRK